MVRRLLHFHRVGGNTLPMLYAEASCQPPKQEKLVLCDAKERSKPR